MRIHPGRGTSLRHSTVLRHRRTPVQGHTLIELLAALALSAMVISAALSLFQTTQKHSLRLIGSAQQRLDAHAAMSVLVVHGRLAGYGLPMAGDKMAHASIHGDAGDVQSGARRRGDSPQPVVGSERIVLRYLADPVSAWLSNTNLPSDCEGKSLYPATGKLAGAHVQVFGDVLSGAPSLHCSESGLGAGGPLVAQVASVQFAYWLKDASHPRRVMQMRSTDWEAVTGFDVCLTMRDASRSVGSTHADRHGGPDLRIGPLNEKCTGPRRYFRTISLRNLREGSEQAHDIL